MTLTCDGVSHVRYLPDNRAVLFLQFKGAPRKTVTTWAAADQAVQRSGCVAYDKHLTKGK